MPKLEFSTDLPISQDRVWEFHQSPGALLLLTPPGTSVMIVGTIPQPAVGVEFSLRVVRFGLPMKWRVRYTEWDPPNGFDDEQLKGPFAMWQHRHAFEAIPTGTRLRDTVEYELPFGSLGVFADRLFVRRDLVKLFQWRHARTIELLKEQE